MNSHVLILLQQEKEIDLDHQSIFVYLFPILHKSLISPVNFDIQIDIQNKDAKIEKFIPMLHPCIQ